MKKNIIKKIIVTILMILVLIFTYELSVALLSLLVDFMERNTIFILMIFVTVKLMDKYYLNNKIKDFIKKIFK